MKNQTTTTNHAEITPTIRQITTLISEAMQAQSPLCSGLGAALQDALTVLDSPNVGSLRNLTRDLRAVATGTHDKTIHEKIGGALHLALGLYEVVKM